jgi:hypothetical protein
VKYFPSGVLELLGLGVFDDYDNVVLLCGLNLDKRVINERFRDVPEYSLALTSNISDSQVLGLLFYGRNFGGKSPFWGKDIFLLYGDSPYTFNDLVGEVYLKVPEKEVAERLQTYAYSLAENGMWGWEILSYVLKRYLELSGKGVFSYSVEVGGGRDAEERRGRLEFLLKMASPPLFMVNEGSGEVLVSDSREEVGYKDVVTVPVYRFLPSFRRRDGKEPVREFFDRLDLRERTAVVTLGGPEHNIFLNYFIYEQKPKNIEQDYQVIFDGSNIFDFERFRRRHLNTVLLDTHRYVGFRLMSSSGEIVTLSRGDPRSSTGALLLVQEIRSELAGGRVFDLYVVIGAGPKGALATKLGFLKLLLDSTQERLRRNGIYFVVFNPERMRDIYSDKDVVYQARDIAPYLDKEDIQEASQVVTVI